MATQSRVPGAASSEVDFELERFERTADDRIEISGRWFGLRGRRFVRPVLNLNSDGSKRRAIALLEHKPWAAEDGQVWLAAFRWPEGAGEVSGAELEVGPGLHVELPALGGKAGAAAVRVTALRPHVPAVPPWRADEGEGHEGAGGRDAGDAATRGGAADDPAARGAGDDPFGRGSSQGRTARESSDPAGRSRRGPAYDGTDASHRRATRAAVPAWTDAPRGEGHVRQAAPPRDVVASVSAERDQAIAARDEAERERIAALQDRDDAFSRRDAALRDVDRSAAERDEATAERDRLEAELERVTRERDHAHAERNRMMQDSEAVARERDQAAAERDAARSELARALPTREQAIRERDDEAARAEQAERERDTALAERKSAVAQRDRARRERDRAMRAAGVEPPEESPYVMPLAAAPDDVPAADPSATAPMDPVAIDRDDAAADEAARIAPARRGDAAGDERAPAQRDDAAGDEPARRDDAAADGPARITPARRDAAVASPPGTPLPSRPIKRIGAGPLGPAPEPKPLLTPVDSGSPRRLSRTRRPPSAPARWAVRIVVLLLMIAFAVVLIMLLGRAL
jgi:hypothetical protein